MIYNPTEVEFITKAYAGVNDRKVEDNYVLKNNDRVRIITDDLSYGSRENWMDIAQTSYAKRKIREFDKKT